MKDYSSFTIDKIEQETELVKSLYLKRTDGKELETFKPGQFLQFRLPVDGKNLLRFYTISDCYTGSHYRVSIKKELATDPVQYPDGKGSFYFHNLKVGSTLEAKGPEGDF